MRTTFIIACAAGFLFACSSSKSTKDAAAQDGAAADTAKSDGAGMSDVAGDTGSGDMASEAAASGGTGPWTATFGATEATLTGLVCKMQRGGVGDDMNLLFGTSPTPPYAGVEVAASMFQTGMDYSSPSAKFIVVAGKAYTSNNANDVTVKFSDFTYGKVVGTFKTAAGTITINNLYDGSNKVAVTPNTIDFTCACTDTVVLGCEM
jgi:hypothetical protein